MYNWLQAEKVFVGEDDDGSLSSGTGTERAKFIISLTWYACLIRSLLGMTHKASSRCQGLSTRWPPCAETLAGEDGTKTHFHYWNCPASWTILWVEGQGQVISGKNQTPSRSTRKLWCTHVRNSIPGGVFEWTPDENTPDLLYYQVWKPRYCSL